MKETKKIRRMIKKLGDYVQEVNDNNNTFRIELEPVKFTVKFIKKARHPGG